MNYRLLLTSLRASFCVLIALLTTAAQAQQATSNTRCLDQQKALCYCVSERFEPLILDKIKFFRGKINDARSQGLLTAYVSIPLSTRGGGYFNLNKEIAATVAAKISADFGAGSIYVLNPATNEGDLMIGPDNATQSEYLFMWSSILWGASEGKPDLDLVYFTAPSDFATALGLTNPPRLTELADIFEHRKSTDQNFAKLVSDGKIVKHDFVAYYSLRASATVSPGAHDEWNTVVLANAARRATYGKDGFATQVAMWSGGRGVEPDDYESPISRGNVGACPPPGTKPLKSKASAVDPLDRRGY